MSAPPLPSRILALPLPVMVSAKLRPGDAFDLEEGIVALPGCGYPLVRSTVTAEATPSNLTVSLPPPH